MCARKSVSVICIEFHVCCMKSIKRIVKSSITNSRPAIKQRLLASDENFLTQYYTGVAILYRCSCSHSARTIHYRLSCLYYEYSHFPCPLAPSFKQNSLFKSIYMLVLELEYISKLTIISLYSHVDDNNLNASEIKGYNILNIQTHATLSRMLYCIHDKRNGLHTEKNKYINVDFSA